MNTFYYNSAYVGKMGTVSPYDETFWYGEGFKRWEYDGCVEYKQITFTA